MAQKITPKDKRKSMTSKKKAIRIANTSAVHRKRTLAVSLKPMLPTEYSLKERRELKMFEREVMDYYK